MLALIYIILGYWAVGRTIYKNRILIGSMTAIFCQKLVLGIFLGWILIPIALIGMLFGR